jgi:chemotaxis signal transduction protein
LFPDYDNHVVPRDELKNIKPKTKQIIIVNLSKKGTYGTHWVGIINKGIKETIYFDSFAVSPPEEVLKFMRSSKSKGLVKNILMTTKKVQNLEDNYCGYAVIKFASNYIIKDQESYEAVQSLTKKNILLFAKKIFKFL